MSLIPFDSVARLPAPDDNIAIVTRRLPAGTQISYGADVLILSHTLLLGHRFAVRTVSVGEALLSWGQTFGAAIAPIAPGDYVCNADVLKELGRRSLDFDLPTAPNFQNDLVNYHFDEVAFRPAAPLERYTDVRTFMGYPRAGGRGVGTRNIVALLGTTAVTAGFVRQLETRLQVHLAAYPQIDGIVAIAHTEGGHGHANNHDLLLRTLAGFIVNPNVAAVLIVDDGNDAVNNNLLRDYLISHAYPLDHVLHHFMSLSASFDDDVAAAEQVVTGWLESVNSARRSPQPISALKIGLQCGGSDAFSGISGNPLAAWVAKEIIRYGGSANLAETDELIGAETYVLDKVRDAATAHKFLAMVNRFKERVAWHGHSAEGNPSGGNKYRGLYNIYLKSLGAATKRHPDVPLDYAIDYGEPMTESGYYFMDSPGNDLESIAGQVASGCNMIFFVTGNGSITNFPFVPTIKIVTTTERYQLLTQEMDINAGAYLDGTPLPELGAATLDYTVAIASGQLSAGEKAGHAQVQIWRNWALAGPLKSQPVAAPPASGQPLAIAPAADVPSVRLPVIRNGDQITTDRVGLVLPTSLCSGQIARMCVEALNKSPRLIGGSISRYVTLVHTEGCGSSINDEFRDTLLGYLSHPFVAHALLLEHGCESTHNDYFRQALRAYGHDPQDFGWASIQLDGGIQNVVRKMVGWFEEQLADETPPETGDGGLEAVRLALIVHGSPSSRAAQTLASLTQMIVTAGGTVIAAEQEALLKSDYFHQLGLADDLYPSLSYANPVAAPGFHLMAMPTRDWGEILTGLGAAGVNIILSLVEQQPMPGHPLVPVLQIGETPRRELDVLLEGAAPAAARHLLESVVQTLSHHYQPQVVRSGNVYFQVTRGLLGVSL